MWLMRYGLGVMAYSHRHSLLVYCLFPTVATVCRQMWSMCYGLGVMVYAHRHSLLLLSLSARSYCLEFKDDAQLWSMRYGLGVMAYSHRHSLLVYCLSPHVATVCYSKRTLRCAMAWVSWSIHIANLGPLVLSRITYSLECYNIEGKHSTCGFLGGCGYALEAFLFVLRHMLLQHASISWGIEIRCHNGCTAFCCKKKQHAEYLLQSFPHF